MHQPVKRSKHGRTRRFASCNPTVPYASRIWVRQDALVHASANKRLELSTGQVDRFTAVRILGPGNSDSGKARQETSRNCSQDQFNHIDSHKPKAHRCSRIWPSYPLSLPLSLSLLATTLAPSQPLEPARLARALTLPPRPRELLPGTCHHRSHYYALCSTQSLRRCTYAYRASGIQHFFCCGCCDSLCCV